MASVQGMDTALSIYGDARRAYKEGRAGIARRQRQRLAEQVSHARARSRYYAELYRGLPERVEDVRRSPVTNKQDLMARFDDWLTDARVTLASVEALVREPRLIVQTEPATLRIRLQLRAGAEPASVWREVLRSSRGCSSSMSSST